MMLKPMLLLLALAATSLALAQSNEKTFTSKSTRAHLLELFTSEGCSSCPPAEAWLSKLKDAPGLWQEVVPVAFHVDYWDRLGWKDPFASRAWTARQYDYSSRWCSGSVYTPGFVLDGREWQSRSLPPASNDEVGVLQIALTKGGNTKVNFSPKNSGRSYQAHVARLGFGLQVNVRAGENCGRKLQHDFVVLALADAPLKNGNAEIRLPADAAPQLDGTRHAIVAWVTEAGKLEPIQAVGGWLP